MGGRAAGDVAPAVKVRVGTLAIPLDTVDVVDVTRADFDVCTACGGCRFLSDVATPD